MKNFDKVYSEGFTEQKSEGSEGAELTGHADNWKRLCHAEGRSGTKTHSRCMIRGQNSRSGVNGERALGNEFRTRSLNIRRSL